jgi:8-oxo-dGTP pyrophosphatase MutT (NUDIX family)
MSVELPSRDAGPELSSTDSVAGQRLTRSWLIERLARGCPPGAVLEGDQGGSIAARQTPAAVLVPIVERSPELTVLFTLRTAHLNDHAGQISFPGGRVEAGDTGAVDTALRETREEIGIDGGRVEILGQLPEYLTRTGYRVTPVVGYLVPPFDLAPDTFEVAEIFEVPLRFLLDPANHLRQSLVVDGATRYFWAIPYDRHYIWGATAGMLMNLYRCLMAAAA